MKRQIHNTKPDDALKGTGMILAALGLVLLVMGLTGCSKEEGDVFAPAIPDGVSSITADGEIWVYWNANREGDLAGYRLWSTTQTNSTGDPIDWELIAEMGPFPDTAGAFYDNESDPGRPTIWFIDSNGVRNGTTYFYAVSAFDVVGNESARSTDYVFDTPRPEGFVDLSAAVIDPDGAGYDFSQFQVRAFDHVDTDVYFTWEGGVPYLLAATDRVRIQDYGQVHFDTASWAPAFGWSRTGRVEAIFDGDPAFEETGHTYILEIYDATNFSGNFRYAKMTVYRLEAGFIRVKWGYQPLSGEPELKQPVAASTDKNLEERS